MKLKKKNVFVFFSPRFSCEIIISCILDLLDPSSSCEDSFIEDSFPVKPCLHKPLALSPSHGISSCCCRNSILLKQQQTRGCWAVAFPKTRRGVLCIELGSSTHSNEWKQAHDESHLKVIGFGSFPLGSNPRTNHVPLFFLALFLLQVFDLTFSLLFWGEGRGSLYLCRFDSINAKWGQDCN